MDTNIRATLFLPSDSGFVPVPVSVFWPLEAVVSVSKNSVTEKHPAVIFLPYAGNHVRDIPSGSYISKENLTDGQKRLTAKELITDYEAHAIAKVTKFDFCSSDMKHLELEVIR